MLILQQQTKSYNNLLRKHPLTFKIKKKVFLFSYIPISSVLRLVIDNIVTDHIIGPTYENYLMFTICSEPSSPFCWLRQSSTGLNFSINWFTLPVINLLSIVLATKIIMICLTTISLLIASVVIHAADIDDSLSNYSQQFAKAIGLSADFVFSAGTNYPAIAEDVTFWCITPWVPQIFHNFMCVPV